MIARKTIESIVLTLLLLTPLFGTLTAQEHHEEEVAEELDITGIILHHVGDSHDFHILDYLTLLFYGLYFNWNFRYIN